MKRLCFSLTITLFTFWLLSTSVYGLIVPVKLGSFDTAGFGSSNPQGITHNASTGEYAIVDATADEVYLVDASGVLQWNFDTAAVGCANTTGIAYNSLTDEYAVTDSSDDEVYVFDAQDGIYKSSFDTAVLGSTSAQGITYNTADNRYAIVDSSIDYAYIVETDGTPYSSFDTTLFGSSNPRGISWNQSTGEYYILDYTAYEVFVVDSTGTLQNQFDTYHGLDGTYFYGIAHISGTECVLVDSNVDEAYFVDIAGVLVDRLLPNQIVQKIPNGLNM